PGYQSTAESRHAASVGCNDSLGTDFFNIVRQTALQLLKPHVMLPTGPSPPNSVRSSQFRGAYSRMRKSCPERSLVSNTSLAGAYRNPEMLYSLASRIPRRDRW